MLDDFRTAAVVFLSSLSSFFLACVHVFASSVLCEKKTGCGESEDEMRGKVKKRSADETACLGSWPCVCVSEREREGRRGDMRVL